MKISTFIQDLKRDIQHRIFQKAWKTKTNTFFSSSMLWLLSKPNCFLTASSTSSTETPNKLWHTLDSMAESKRLQEISRNRKIIFLHQHSTQLIYFLQEGKGVIKMRERIRKDKFGFKNTHWALSYLLFPLSGCTGVRWQRSFGVRMLLCGLALTLPPQWLLVVWSLHPYCCRLTPPPSIPAMNIWN